jgi:hypothetical protein
MLALSLLLYGYEAAVGARILIDPHNQGNILGLTEILLGVYAVGLVRAWELLGAPRGGIAGWLNPLQDLPDTLPAPGLPQAPEGMPASEVSTRPPPRGGDAPPAVR